jgi:hypothetical protein
METHLVPKTVIFFIQSSLKAEFGENYVLNLHISSHWIAVHKSNTLASIILIIGGSLISGTSYFMLSTETTQTSFVALGIACIMLGMMSAALPEKLLGSSSMKAILGSAMLAIDFTLQQVCRIPSECTDSKFEDTSQSSVHDSPRRGVYLPPSEDGIIYAFVPFGKSVDQPDLSLMSSAPLEFDAKSYGMRVFPIGARIREINEVFGKEEAPEVSSPMISESLEYVLVDSAEICSAINLIELESELILEIKDIKVQIQTKNYTQLLGSIPASLAACVIAAVRRQPVVIIDEINSDRTVLVRFRILRK